MYQVTRLYFCHFPVGSFAVRRCHAHYSLISIDASNTWAASPATGTITQSYQFAEPARWRLTDPHGQ